jgi:hypothetical protein
MWFITVFYIIHRDLQLVKYLHLHFSCIEFLSLLFGNFIKFGNLTQESDLVQKIVTTINAVLHRTNQGSKISLARGKHLRLKEVQHTSQILS